MAAKDGVQNQLKVFVLQFQTPPCNGNGAIFGARHIGREVITHLPELERQVGIISPEIGTQALQPRESRVEVLFPDLLQAFGQPRPSFFLFFAGRESFDEPIFHRRVPWRDSGTQGVPSFSAKGRNSGGAGATKRDADMVYLAFCLFLTVGGGRAFDFFGSREFLPEMSLTKYSFQAIFLSWNGKWNIPMNSRLGG